MKLMKVVLIKSLLLAGLLVGIVWSAASSAGGIVINNHVVIAPAYPMPPRVVVVQPRYGYGYHHGMHHRAAHVHVYRMGVWPYSRRVNCIMVH